MSFPQTIIAYNSLQVIMIHQESGAHKIAQEVQVLTEFSVPFLTSIRRLNDAPAANRFILFSLCS